MEIGSLNAYDIESAGKLFIIFLLSVIFMASIAVYYDSEGRLTQYPSKKPLRIIVLSKIADCFCQDKKYTEKEVNEIIRQNISFSDVELIRRELFQQKLMGRLRDGSQYWRER